MNKWENYTVKAHEKKQLEEIAHLYFSGSETSSRKVSPAKRKTGLLPQSSPAYFIYCASSRGESSLSLRFLYNLSVMLKIYNETVLFIGSEKAYKKRYSYGFRPHRERVMHKGRADVPLGCFGPLGVCLMDSRSLNNMNNSGTEGIEEGIVLDAFSPFRYILSDEATSSLLLNSLSGLVLFLVTPTTAENAFIEIETKAWEQLSARFDQAGIVVAGTDGFEESEDLYLNWRERLERIYPNKVIMEDYGRFPLDVKREDSGAGCEVDVLERPGSGQTKCFQTTASQIRNKRQEALCRLA